MMKHILIAALQRVVVANTFTNLFRKTVKEPHFQYEWQEWIFEEQEGEWESGLEPSEIAEYIGYEVDENFDTDHEDWDDVAKKYIKKRFAAFQEKFSSKATMNKNQLEIYRCVSVDDPQEILDQIDNDDERGLGYYWAFTKEGAKCYHGNREHKITLTALVRPNDIDAERTVIVNMEPGGTEDEIFVEEGVQVTLIKAQTGDYKTIWEGKKKVSA